MMRRVTALTLAALMTVTAVPAVVLADESDEIKTVRIGAPYDPTTLDYAELNVDPATWMDLMIGETLIRNKQGEYIGGLAESWEVSDDAKTWTFTLKEGLTYSDGETPVTAEDLEYAVKRLLDPEAGHYNAESGYIFANGEEYYAGECEWDEVGINVIDELTIEYTFKNPQYETTFMSTSVFAPLEQAFVEELGAEYGSAADKLLTDGPFSVAEWISDSSVKLVKNENYWDAENIHMDEINIILGAAGDTALDMMLAGELDFAPSGNAEQNQILADEGFANFVYTTSYQCLNLNHTGKTDESGLFLGNANFRRAINCAIDREALSASVITSCAPATRLTAPSEAGVEGKFNDEYEYEGWSSTADPEKAKEYLDLALEELGKTIEDVPVLDLLCYESQGAIDALAAVQDMLKTNLGIESQINPQTIQVMISNAMNGDYDLWYGGNSLGIPDALDGFLSGYTTAMRTPLRDYSNEEYDALYEAAISAPTLKERKDNYFEVEKFFCDNVLIILLGWSNGGYNYKSEYTGFYYDVDVDFTYLDIDEAE